MGELTSAFAHELNQPLCAILTNAKAAGNLLAAAEPDFQEVADSLGDIARETERARELMQRLRELIRKGEIKQEILDINETLRGVEDLARTEARQRNVSLVMDLAEDLPAIQGDRIQLQQVLLNLVRNGAAAMAKTEDGQQPLVVRTYSQDPQTVVVAVSDAGPPLTDEVLAGMFEPFFTTKADGLGMGLPICRTIIEAHGGKLWATPNPDRGLTVQFTLPREGKRATA
jgi:C4-dicarboxylate-specific signal transduction histidine kinase